MAEHIRKFNEVLTGARASFPTTYTDSLSGSEHSGLDRPSTQRSQAPSPLPSQTKARAESASPPAMNPLRLQSHRTRKKDSPAQQDVKGCLGHASTARAHSNGKQVLSARAAGCSIGDPGPRACFLVVGGISSSPVEIWTKVSRWVPTLYL